MATIGEKELKTKWPHETGLDAEDKHEGRKVNLIAERKSLVPKREKVGL